MYTPNAPARSLPAPALDRRRIRAALGEAGLQPLLAVNPELDQQLADWLEALLASPHNLTAVREPESAMAKHVIEPLRGWEAALAADLPVPQGPLIDVGSGNGAPGLPIALAEPQRRAALLDSRRTAARFLSAAAAPYGRIEALHDRAELVGLGPLRGRFAVALSRAAAPPPIALELCLPLLGLGGLLAVWTGPLSAAETEQLAEAAAALGAIRAPIAAEPGIFAAIKSRPTPDRYPRRWPLIRRAPLGRRR